MIDEGKIMTTEMAQKTIQSCLDAFVLYLKDTCNFTESTLVKYRSSANSILKTFTVPFFRIDECMLNERIKEIYNNKNWTSKYTDQVLNMVAGLWHWARFIAPHAYTLKSITLIDPRTNEKTYCSNFIAKLTACPNTEKESVKVVNKKKEPVYKTDVCKVSVPPIKESSNPTSIKYLPEEVILKRDIAIKSLINKSNLSPREVSELMLFDFMHNRVVIQSQNVRTLMRVVLLDYETRNAIYDYLKTRKDSNEYLFESIFAEKAITEDEVFDLTHI